MTRLKQTILFICFILLLSGCNLFPYLPTPTSPPPADQIDPTPTTSVLPPTATLDQPQSTATQAATATPQPSPTAIVLADFVLQTGNPIYLENFVHPSAGCKWMGVAGQVFDQDGTEVQGFTIVFGNSEDEENTRASLTGMASAYGAGGYEIQIADAPLATSGYFWVQVVDQDGIARSEKIYFDTYEDCSQNLILLNFVPR